MSLLSLEAGKRASVILNRKIDPGWKSGELRRLCLEAGQDRFVSHEVCCLFYLFLEQYLLSEGKS